MNTKEAATYIDENGGGPLPLDVWAVIMKGLRLLAALDDASGPTPETDALYGNPDRTEADEHYHAVRLERERNAALRALDQERRSNNRAAQDMSAREFAEKLHSAYERLAPQFGYVTRQDTRQFDADSRNGKLMVEAIQEVFRALAQMKEGR